MNVVVAASKRGGKEGTTIGLWMAWHYTLQLPIEFLWGVENRYLPSSSSSSFVSGAEKNTKQKLCLWKCITRYKKKCTRVTRKKTRSRSERERVTPGATQKMASKIYAAAVFTTKPAASYQFQKDLTTCMHVSEARMHAVRT